MFIFFVRAARMLRFRERKKRFFWPKKWPDSHLIIPSSWRTYRPSTSNFRPVETIIDQSLIQRTSGRIRRSTNSTDRMHGEFRIVPHLDSGIGAWSLNSGDNRMTTGKTGSDLFYFRKESSAAINADLVGCSHPDFPLLKHNFFGGERSYNFRFEPEFKWECSGV